MLDQGAAYLYQLNDAYGVLSPNDIENFKSGNHTGLYDTITFNLQGYSCVYTYRIMTFSSGLIGGVSLFVRGSSSTGYYQGIADVYLSARKQLINNKNFYVFERDNPGLLDTLLKKQVCYQATLDQTANNTMGAAINLSWYKNLNAGNPWQWASW